jgi:hypothetical protein
MKTLFYTGGFTNMKKTLVVLFCVTLALVLASAAMAFTGSYAAGTGINGTVHDLRPSNLGLSYPAIPADDKTRICIYCHAPHHAYRTNAAGLNGTGPLAPADYTYLPLWNHQVTAQAFVPYYNGVDAPQSGPKASQALANFDKIGAVSLLCLSCHDGTVAVNEYGNATQDSNSRSAGGGMIADQYKIGKDGNLGNHHPIGFAWADVVGTDKEIADASTAAFGVTLKVADVLYNGKMECSTCHAVHNKGNSGEKLLHISDANSNLCLTCHLKGTITP